MLDSIIIQKINAPIADLREGVAKKRFLVMHASEEENFPFTALNVANFLKGIIHTKIKIKTSSVKRAKDTAEIIGHAFCVPVVEDSYLARQYFHRCHYEVLMEEYYEGAIVLVATDNFCARTLEGIGVKGFISVPYGCVWDITPPETPRKIFTPKTCGKTI